MKKLTFSCLLAALCLCVSATARDKPIAALHIGDRVPDAVYDLLGIPTAGKGTRTAVLIDFWELSCGTCVAALPKLDSLQKKYAGKLKIITITSLYDKARIRRVLEKYPRTRGIKLPILTGDSLLRRYFPFVLISHLVWIDNTGMIQAITGTAEVNPVNLETLIAGGPLRLPVKQDIAAFDYDAPLLVANANGSNANSAALYYSGFTGRMEGVGSHTSIVHDSANKITRYTIFNVTLLQLGRLALENSGAGIPVKLLELETQDTAAYLCPPGMSKTLWKKEHEYCYTLQMPLQHDRAALKQAIRRQLSTGLETNYGIRLEKTEKMMPCLILQPGDRISTAQSETTGLLYNNLSELMAVLIEQSPLPYVFNETGIHTLTEMKIRIPPEALQDAQALDAALAAYGIRVVADTRLQTIYQLKRTR